MKSTTIILCAQLLIAATNGFQQHAFQQSQRRVRLDSAFRSQSGSPNLEGSETELTPSSPATQASGDLPPVLQQIVDERAEFNMNLGKAMDTLRRDMPEILHTPPDFSLYHPEISVIDPSGVRITGLRGYKSAFSFFQSFIKFWFSSRSSRLQYRMVYDFARSTIRVSWNTVLVPKLPLGRPLFIDGISHYKLDASSGKIIEHKIERLVMNDTPVVPPYGMFSMLQQDIMGRSRQPQGVPVGVGALILTEQ